MVHTGLLPLSAVKNDCKSPEPISQSGVCVAQSAEEVTAVVSSTAFLVTLAALNSAAAGTALAAGTAVSSNVQGPNTASALVSASGSQAVDKAVSTAVDAVKVQCLSHARQQL